MAPLGAGKNPAMMLPMTDLATAGSTHGTVPAKGTELFYWSIGSGLRRLEALQEEGPFSADEYAQKRRSRPTQVVIFERRPYREVGA